MHEQIIRRSDAPQLTAVQSGDQGWHGRSGSIGVPRTDHYNGMAGRSRTP
jgi:hypothetical protein